MKLHELDGVYHCIYAGHAEGSKRSKEAIPGMHAYFMIKRGRVVGLDATGCVCRGKASFNKKGVLLKTTWNMSLADKNAGILNEKGEFTRNQVTHSIELKIENLGDLSLSGQLALGAAHLELFFRRIGTLDVG